MEEDKNKNGEQRLSIEKLKAWEDLKYGMFIHFGMSTYDGDELSMGNKPATDYCPNKLDVDQWVAVARDAGMKYAVLTAKHVAGHCLWPTQHTDYHVGNSGNKTDVVEAFVKACEKYGVMPGIYYCSWDNRHLFGSMTPTLTKTPFTTQEYHDFQSKQVRELLTNYGDIGEVWIDIPNVLPRSYRQVLYNEIAELQPNTVIMMNNGINDGSNYPIADAWPADLIAIERFLPNGLVGHKRWREIHEKNYYMPGEVCETIGKNWFFVEEDRPRSDAELLGMYLVSRGRDANLLLDVGPDKTGQITDYNVDALMRLRKNIDRFGME